MDSQSSRFNRFALILILLFAGLAAAYFFFEARERSELQAKERPEGNPPYFVEASVTDNAEAVSATVEITHSRSNAIVEAAQKVGPSVVSISTVQVQTVRDPWFDLFYPFGGGMKRKYYGLGSGFIIDKRGYILTNQHVIENADEIKVTLASGDEFEAKFIGVDHEFDLAVLKIRAKSELPATELGDSSNLLVGEWAIAIGSPFGFLLEDAQPTVTVGVISAIGRSIQQNGMIFSDLVQTDASINPGNSGGPLVNCYGQVIGINTAIFSTSGGSQGIGFAMPINTAKRVINELIQHGMVIESWVGIGYQELSEDIIEHLGSTVSQGLLISDIVEGGPAQKAGLMRGDIVIKIGDQPVRTLDEAADVGKMLQSGQKVIFHVMRGGEFRDITVEVGVTEASGMARTLLGITVQTPTSETARKYKLSSYRKGVLVIQVDRNSPADKAELRRGDLILRVAKEQNGFFRSFEGDGETDIRTMDDFRKFVSGIRRGQRIRIILEREKELWRTYLTVVGN